MPNYEYQVLPAPRRGQKAKGVRGTEARFAHAMAIVMNEQAREGWEFQRAETLPCDERSGIGGKTTTYQNVLVFRRLLTDETVNSRAAAHDDTALSEDFDAEDGADDIDTTGDVDDADDTAETDNTVHPFRSRADTDIDDAAQKEPV